jgi:hypothetical protein
VREPPPLGSCEGALLKVLALAPDEGVFKKLLS